MIIEFLVLIASCTVTYELLKACGLGKACAVVGIAGIMAHELGHIVGCLLFRVKIHSVSFLRVEWIGKQFAGFSGSVDPDRPKSAFPAIAITVAPLAGGLLFLLLIAWGITAVQASGADPALAFLLWVLLFSVALAAWPSLPDWKIMLSAAAEYPGQFMMALLGIAIGLGLCWWLLPLVAEGWSIVADIGLVFGPGWVLATVYQKARGQ
nr:hypothetical protein [Candidatus Sigynarchaeota archaeon]